MQLKINFSIANTKKLQSSTTPILDFKQQLPFLASNNSPSSPAMGFELMTPGLPAQCLIHSSTRSLIKKHEKLPILIHIRLAKYVQLDARYLQLDTKCLQLKIYFSIQIQNICNGKSIFQFRYKKMQTCRRNVGFCKKYTKKLQTFYKICVETQKNQYVNFKCNTVAKTLRFNQKDLHLQRFLPQ